MSIPAAWPQVFDYFATPLVLEPSPGPLTGDAGLVLTCADNDQFVILSLRPGDDLGR
jgi:hypothetical protein